jgi:exonuclease VII small subunit
VKKQADKTHLQGSKNKKIADLEEVVKSLKNQT